jgi:hypothetical protein
MRFTKMNEATDNCGGKKEVNQDVFVNSRASSSGGSKG